MHCNECFISGASLESALNCKQENPPSTKQWIINNTWQNINNDIENVS